MKKRIITAAVMLLAVCLAPWCEAQAASGREITTVTVSAAGDVTLGTNQKMDYSRTFHEYYDRFGPDYFLKNVKGVFAADDLTVVNCEGTLTDSDAIVEKQWNHKGRPEYVQILADASVEAATLGNNHIMDYGPEGVSDTMRVLSEAGITYSISGAWGNTLGMYETKGIRIGIVSVNELYEWYDAEMHFENGYRELREQGADIVIACPHWGGDKTHVIDDDQYRLGRWCIDLGYDLVLGCHPHVVQGIECYRGKFIVYSMGNFCYGGSYNPADKDSMIFQQTFVFQNGILQDETEVRAIPCRLSTATTYNDYCPVILAGAEADAMIANLNGYSAEFGIAFDRLGRLVESELEGSVKKVGGRLAMPM